MSSDSGSAINFRAFEDGCGTLGLSEDTTRDADSESRSFAAYAASKAALNQALRVGIANKSVLTWLMIQ